MLSSCSLAERIIHNEFHITNAVESAANLWRAEAMQVGVPEKMKGNTFTADKTLYMKVLRDERWTTPGGAVANEFVQSRLSTNESEGRFNHVNVNVLQNINQKLRA